jgi:octaprenyl-diphosphate synthase
MAQATEVYAPIKPGMAATEAVLAELFDSDSEAIADLCSHLNTFGGKRLRPALVHLCGGLVGQPTHEHAEVGAIIETLHITSLLHDDVLDEADTRRQVPTLNALHGNEIPILLGDLLYARAFTLMLDLSTLEAAKELAKSTALVCRGEIEQSFFRLATDLDEQRYYRVIRDKTASLYASSCRLGALYAGSTHEDAERLAKFGFDLGMAFQIIDDCLDVVGDENIVGKSLGTDLETGKITLPIIRLSRKLSDDDLPRFKELLHGEVVGSRREALCEAFDLEGVVHECQQEANGFVESCLETLEPFEDRPEKQSLQAICSFVLAREY